MNISSLNDLEDLGYLDLEFKLSEKGIRIVSSSSMTITRASIPITTRFLIVKATFKWGSRVIKNLQYRLDDRVAKFLELNWPDDLDQLQMFMMLAGAHDVLMQLENDIVGEYNKYNDHDGALANVRS